MIPGLTSKSPITYGWSGYDLVEVFSSQSELSDYETFLTNLNFRIEKIQDCQECLQYRMFQGNRETHSYEIIAASLDYEDDVYDIESYVGESEFAGLDRSGAKTIGAFFHKTGTEANNESEQGDAGKPNPVAS